jgi:dipeptidyl aminopeptidase/acylaminoacyl peptidase
MTRTRVSSSSSNNSPTSAAQACAQQSDFSQIAYSPKGVLGWLERSDRTNQQTQLVCQEEGQLRQLSAPGVSVGSRVHEYGGRAWCWGANCVYYVEQASQQLFRADLDTDKLEQLTDHLNQRFMEPLWHQPTNSLIFIWELHSAIEVENRIGRLDLETGEIVTLQAGNDFYSGLTLSPQQDRLAWVTWNHPSLPWTDTQIYCAELTDEGLSNTRAIPREQADSESMVMPSFSADGQLCFVSDHSGYWSIYSRDELSNRTTPLSREQIDHISSPWQSGIRQYEKTSDALIRFEYSATGVELFIGEQRLALPGYNHFRELSYHQGLLAVIAAGPAEALQLLEIDIIGARPKRLTPPHREDIERTCLPKLIEFEVNGHQVHGYYYAASNTVNQRPTLAEPPPLLITLHGGPTSSTYPIFNLAIQYWCNQGFALFDLNYRGSSNSGRHYRFALKKSWGKTDVEDIEHAIKHLIDLGLAQAGKVFIRGRSSGGFSALLALAKSDKIAAGTSYFGVMDPETLKQSTHKFESHYLDWLLPEKNYDTPRSLIDKIRSPVLFLQGMRDSVVTPDQTQRMVNALEQRGVDVTAKYFSDEGHGFRKLENQISALETELAFYRRVIDSNPGNETRTIEG